MEDKILIAMASGTPMKSKEVADACGITNDEATKAIKKLVAENKVSSPKRCYYQIVK